jgi:DNA-binding HxlR family transcriptional regulator
MNHKFRCDCPITSTLDILGDKWILVIVKQMLIEGKKTFKEFLESDEMIATNILSSRLKHLEDLEIVTKSKHPTNKKMNLYHLTDKGLSLTPLILELAIWADKNLRELNKDMRKSAELNLIKKDKNRFAKNIQKNYRKNIEG